jgi:hypothetical protein
MAFFLALDDRKAATGQGVQRNGFTLLPSCVIILAELNQHYCTLIQGLSIGHVTCEQVSKTCCRVRVIVLEDTFSKSVRHKKYLR